jgi:hypothetical protein
MSNMSPMSTSFRSLTDRDYTPVSAGGAVDRHEDVHEYAATHGTASNASLALVTRPAAAAVERGATNLPGDAALSSQSVESVNSAIAQSANGSRADGQSGAASNSLADRAQNELLELTGGERLKLKRKQAGLTAEADEEAREATDRSEQYDASDAQVAYDPTRPFDVGAIPDAALRQASIASVADDGLIDVLAADVTAVIVSGDVIERAAANRQIIMEPAMATYQAFETIVDGDPRVAADAVADAAGLAGAVAMNGQPVVQAE